MNSAADKAYATIRGLIVKGEAAPGSRLKEELLAESSGVSRTPIREALRALASEGLVQLVPHSGYFVTTWSARDISRICKVRSLLESEAARLAAAQICEEELEQLKSLASRMSEIARGADAARLVDLATLNRAFHNRILEISGDERLLGMASQMIELPISYRNFESYTGEEMQRSMAHHHEIIAAFANRDGEWAAAVMTAHILASKHSLLSRFDAG